MQAYSHDQKLVAMAMCVIGTLFLQATEDNLKQSTWKQAIGTVVVLMRALSSVESVQAFGCFAMTGFARQSLCDQVFMEQNCFQSIENAMRLYSQSEFIQDSAATAIVHYL